MNHETHIFMFGLKYEKAYTIGTCRCFIIYKQTDERTDR